MNNTYQNEMYLRNLLAGNAAPVFAKKKPAGLVTVWKYHFTSFDLSDYLRQYKKEILGECEYEILLETPLYYLLFFYQQPELINTLEQIKDSYLFSEYLAKEILSDQLVLLKEKIRRFYQQKTGYPHEIGLFLGYPVWDVEGFVEHAGEDYKLCGYWKVYDDLPGAVKTFQEYDLLKKESVKYFQQVFAINNHKK